MTCDMCKYGTLLENGNYDCSKAVDEISKAAALTDTPCSIARPKNDYLAKKSDSRICPLIGTNDSPAPCRGAACAWWVVDLVDVGRCAIAAIAERRF